MTPYFRVAADDLEAFDDALSTFHDRCRRCELSFDVDRLYRPDETADLGQYGLTADQREALLAALRAGYFDVPRGATLAAVAALVEAKNVSRTDLLPLFERVDPDALNSVVEAATVRFRYADLRVTASSDAVVVRDPAD